MGFERSHQLADAIHLTPADSGAQELRGRGGILRPTGCHDIAGERELRARTGRELASDLPGFTVARPLCQLVELICERALGGVIRWESFLAAGQHVTLCTGLGILQRRERGTKLIE